MRKTPDGKSHFVTIPKTQLGTQSAGPVMTPAAKKAMPGAARKSTVSPTQFIQKSNQPYTELAEAEHAAAMLMGEYCTPSSYEAEHRNSSLSHSHLDDLASQQ